MGPEIVAKHVLLSKESLLKIHGEMGDINTSLDPAWISFDPGDDTKPSTGVTLWNKEGVVLQTNELSVENLYLLLDWIELSCAPNAFIVEEFRLYQHKALAQSGSKLPTVQIIGSIKYCAHRLGISGIDVYEIRADAKKIAAAWSQTKIPTGHLPNWMASYLIGYYHLHKIGIIKAKVLGT